MAPAASPTTTVVIHNRLATSVLVHRDQGGGPSLQIDAGQPFAHFALPPIDLRTSHRLYLSLFQPHVVSFNSKEESQRAQHVVEFLPTKREDTIRAARRVSTAAAAGHAQHDDVLHLKWAPSQLHAHPTTPFRSMMSAPDPQGNRHLLLFAANRSKFLSLLPASTPLSAVCLPGTHESLALYGAISQCQTATLTSQLQAGIRFFDFRLSTKGDVGQERLMAYHGIADQKRELGDALDEVYRWLDGEGKNETLIISLKPEGSPSAPWATLLWDRHTQPKRSRWWLDDSIPTLGQVRGKIVMFSRWIPLPGKPADINSRKWPDSFDGSFSYDLASGQEVLTQDWYNIGSLTSMPHKIDLITAALAEAGSDPTTLAINFTSCASFPLAPADTSALGRFTSGPSCLKVTGMNARLRDLVASRLMIRTAGYVAAQQQPVEERKRGWSPSTDASQQLATAAATPAALLPGLASIFAMDFYDTGEAQDLVPLLVEANFAPSTSTRFGKSSVDS